MAQAFSKLLSHIWQPASQPLVCSENSKEEGGGVGEEEEEEKLAEQIHRT